MNAIPAATRAVVSLCDVGVVLGGRTVLQRVTADFLPGELVVVLGPNGAGKTTLLRVLLGLQRPVTGSVLIDGRPVRRGSSRVGYTPQRRELDRDLPVRGYDLVGLGLDGDRWGVPLFDARRKRRRIEQVIASVGAEAYLEAPVGRLSGGEQQRLLIAQALVNEPPLLLLDEPLANLDLRSQQEIVTLVGRIARELHTTVVLVAHDVNPLLPVLDQVLYLARGQAALGKPDDIITSERLSQLYGSPVDVFRSRGRVFVAAMGALEEG